MNNENTEYYPDAVDIVLDECRRLLSDTYRAFYEGEPDNGIPKSNLPCVIVELMEGQVTLNGAPTGHDRQGQGIVIRLCLNKADDAGADDTIDLTERKLRRAVFGRDPVTRSWKEGTIMHMLRNNLTVGRLFSNSDVQVNFDVIRQSEDLKTSEAIIQVDMTGNVQMSARN